MNGCNGMSPVRPTRRVVSLACTPPAIPRLDLDLSISGEAKSVNAEAADQQALFSIANQLLCPVRHTSISDFNFTTLPIGCVDLEAEVLIVAAATGTRRIKVA